MLLREPNSGETPLCLSPCGCERFDCLSCDIGLHYRGDGLAVCSAGVTHLHGATVSVPNINVSVSKRGVKDASFGGDGLTVHADGITIDGYMVLFLCFIAR